MKETQNKLLNQVNRLAEFHSPSDIQLLASELSNYFTSVDVKLDTLTHQHDELHKKYIRSTEMNGELLARIPVDGQQNIDGDGKPKEPEKNSTKTAEDIAKEILEGGDLNG